MLPRKNLCPLKWRRLAPFLLFVLFIGLISTLGVRPRFPQPVLPLIPRPLVPQLVRPLILLPIRPLILLLIRRSRFPQPVPRCSSLISQFFSCFLGCFLGCFLCRSVVRRFR